jgi:translation elongation factor EF-G
MRMISRIIEIEKKFLDFKPKFKEYLKKAKVPLPEMFGYATDIRNRTQGQGNFAILAQNIAAK